MTAKARWRARLTVTALATAMIAAATLIAAAPAHADRAQDCEALMSRALVEFHLYEWYGIAYGYDSRQATGHLETSEGMADFWMVNC